MKLYETQRPWIGSIISKSFKSSKYKSFFLRYLFLFLADFNRFIKQWRFKTKFSIRFERNHKIMHMFSVIVNVQSNEPKWNHKQQILNVSIAFLCHNDFVFFSFYIKRIRIGVGFVSSWKFVEFIASIHPFFIHYNGNI